MTHAQNRQQAAHRCMNRILPMLEWTELQYCYFMYGEGLKYLQIYLQGDMHAIGIIERSPVFWGWWKNHWTIRDEVYLQSYEEMCQISLYFREAAYKALHNADLLTQEKEYYSIGLGDSYAAMFGKMIDASVKKPKKQKA